MTEEQAFHIIEETIYQITGIKNLTNDTNFVTDLALNSLDVANLVCAFEEHFQTEIPLKDVWQLNQVKDVVDYLTKDGGNGQPITEKWNPPG